MIDETDDDDTSKIYDKGVIIINGHELSYYFERAVILGQPGEPKTPYMNDGGLVLRGNLDGVFAAFDLLAPGVKSRKNKPSTIKGGG